MKRFAVLVVVLMCLASAEPFVFADTHIGVPLQIPANMKVHIFYQFSNGTTPDFWIQTGVSAIDLTSWLQENWVNYTLYSASTQILSFGGAQPVLMVIDGTVRLLNNGWTFVGGVVTVTGATTSVSAQYFGTAGYTWTLRARDASGATLYEVMTFKGTYGNGTTFQKTSNQYGVATISGVYTGTHTLQTWWGDHLTKSQSVSFTGTTTTDVSTYTRVLTDGSKRITMSLNNTAIPAIQYLSSANLKLNTVSASGLVSFKADCGSWAQSGQPAAVIVGAYSYVSTTSSWAWSGTMLEVSCSFPMTTVDMEIKWVASAPPDGGTQTTTPPQNPPVNNNPPPSEPPPSTEVPTQPWTPIAPLPNITTGGVPSVDTSAVAIVLIAVVVVLTVFGAKKLVSAQSITKLWEKRTGGKKQKKQKWGRSE